MLPLRRQPSVADPHLHGGSRALGGVGGEGLSDVLDRHVARCELAGAPSAFRIDPLGRWRFVRMPLLGKAESYTMDGKAAVSPAELFVPVQGRGHASLLQLPDHLAALPLGHAITFRLRPISALETEVQTKWLVHKDAVEGVDYDLKRLTEVWSTPTTRIGSSSRTTRRASSRPPTVRGRTRACRRAAWSSSWNGTSTPLAARPATRPSWRRSERREPLSSPPSTSRRSAGHRLARCLRLRSRAPDAPKRCLVPR